MSKRKHERDSAEDALEALDAVDPDRVADVLEEMTEAGDD